jgi:hypothetical protein
VEVERGVSREEAKALGERLGVDWGEIPLAAFQAGLKVEREHRDVTGGDPLATAKIALAHLKERPDYYARLKQVEEGTPVAKAVRLEGSPFFPLLLSKALRVKAEHGGGEVVGIDHLSHDSGSGMGHYAVHVRDKDGNVTTKHWLLHHSVVQRAVQHRSNTGGVRVKRVYQTAYKAPVAAKNSPGGQTPAPGVKNAAAAANAPKAAKVAAGAVAQSGAVPPAVPVKAPEGANTAPQTPPAVPQPAPSAKPAETPQPIQTRFFGMRRQGAQLHLQHNPVGFAGKQLHESPLTRISHQGDVAGSEDAIYHGHAASGKVYAFRTKKADMAKWGNYMDEESRLHHQEIAGGAKPAGAKPPVVRKEPLIR